MEKERTCLSCGVDDEESPLITLSYGGQPGWVCPRCMPVLIHQPDRLADTLKALRR